VSAVSSAGGICDAQQQSVSSCMSWLGATRGLTVDVLSHFSMGQEFRAA